MPPIVACGDRNNTYDSFKAGHATGGINAVLLVDAEGPVSAKTAWGHLRKRDGWSRPRGTSDEQCHLMVQVMESWFLADVKALEGYFGWGFRRGALPKIADIEMVRKQDVEEGLERGAKGTVKGGYRKGRDSFEVLGRLDPGKVREASEHAERFLRVLL